MSTVRTLTWGAVTLLAVIASPGQSWAWGGVRVGIGIGIPIGGPWYGGYPYYPYYPYPY